MNEWVKKCIAHNPASPLGNGCMLHIRCTISDPGGGGRLAEGSGSASSCHCRQLAWWVVVSSPDQRLPRANEGSMLSAMVIRTASQKLDVLLFPPCQQWWVTYSDESDPLKEANQLRCPGGCVRRAMWDLAEGAAVLEQSAGWDLSATSGVKTLGLTL